MIGITFEGGDGSKNPELFNPPRSTYKLRFTPSGGSLGNEPCVGRVKITLADGTLLLRNETYRKSYNESYSILSENKIITNNGTSILITKDQYDNYDLGKTKYKCYAYSLANNYGNYTGIYQTYQSLYSGVLDYSDSDYYNSAKNASAYLELTLYDIPKIKSISFGCNYTGRTQFYNDTCGVIITKNDEVIHSETYTGLTDFNGSKPDVTINL